MGNFPFAERAKPATKKRRPQPAVVVRPAWAFDARGIPLFACGTFSVRQSIRTSPKLHIMKATPLFSVVFAALVCCRVESRPLPSAGEGKVVVQAAKRTVGSALPIQVFFRDSKKSIIEFGFEGGHLDNGDEVQGFSSGGGSLSFSCPASGGWVSGEIAASTLKDRSVGGNGERFSSFDWIDVPLPYHEKSETARHFEAVDANSKLRLVLQSAAIEEGALFVRLRAQLPIQALPRDVLWSFVVEAQDSASQNLTLTGDSGIEQPNGKGQEFWFRFALPSTSPSGPFHYRVNSYLSSFAWQLQQPLAYVPIRFYVPPLPPVAIADGSQELDGWNLQTYNGDSLRIGVSPHSREDIRYYPDLHAATFEKQISNGRFEVSRVVFREGERILGEEPWPILVHDIAVQGRWLDPHWQKFYFQYPARQLQSPKWQGLSVLETRWQKVISRAVTGNFGPFRVAQLTREVRFSKGVSMPHGVLQIRALQLPPRRPEKYENNQRFPLALWFEYKSRNARFHFVPTRIFWQDEKGGRLPASLSHLDAWNVWAKRPRLMCDPIPNAWRSQFIAPVRKKLWLTIEGIEKEATGPVVVHTRPVA